SSLCYCSFFFFSSRRRHTRSKRDWSSDVCSSDLVSSYVYSELCKRDYAHSSRIAGARRAPGGGDRPPSAYSGGPRSVSRSGAKQKELCIRSPFRRARAGAAKAARRIRRHSLCKMSAGEKDGLPPGGRGEMSGRSWEGFSGPPQSQSTAWRGSTDGTAGLRPEPVRGRRERKRRQRPDPPPRAE